MSNLFINTAKKLKERIDSVMQSSAERRHSMVGQAKLWKVKRDFQIQFLKQTGLQPFHQFLELGCGTLRGGIPVIEYLETEHYTGIEARANVLEEGKNELIEANLSNKKPLLIAEDDIKKIKLDKKFDYIWAFSVLMHMNDEILNNCFSFVHEVLKDDGVFYANISDTNKPQGEWQGFPVMHHKLEFYKEVCFNNNLHCESLGTLKNLGHITGIQTHDSQDMLKIWK